jgi:hypothetical protein
MIDAVTLGHYREFRKRSPFMLVGCNALQALQAARTLARFREYEGACLVRLRSEFDSDADTSFMSEREYDAWNGEAFGSISEYLCPACGSWLGADSIWGHIGYRDVLDPFENPYIVELMASALDCIDGAYSQAVCA